MARGWGPLAALTALWPSVGGGSHGRTENTLVLKTFTNENSFMSHIFNQNVNMFLVETQLILVQIEGQLSSKLLTINGNGFILSFIGVSFRNKN